MLLCINDGLDHHNGLDACIRMVCNTAFFGQFRLGELVHPKQGLSHFNHNTHSTASDLDARHGYKLHIPYTKTNKGRGDTVGIPEHTSAADATHAIRVHCVINRISASSPLCSYLDGNGSRYLLTRNKLLSRVNDILSSGGFDTISGHSFRVGGTSFYLISGVSPEVVKSMGRWKSDAFLMYWRFVSDIASLHLAKNTHCGFV
jgi:hypothetical protein